MTLKLVVTTNAKTDTTELLLRNNSYGVGRRHDNDLRINEASISGYHAELNRTSGGVYEVCDLESANGTFLNGVRISSAKKIKAGDFLKFGIHKVAVVEHQGEEPEPKKSSGPIGGKPKIVSLKDRFAFAKQQSDNTASLSPRTKSGKVSPEKITTKETSSLPDTTTSQNGTELAISNLRKKLAKSGKENSELNQKIEALEAALSEKKTEIESIEKTASSKGANSKELAKLKSELKEVRELLAKREKELAEQNQDSPSAGHGDIILFDAEGSPVEEAPGDLRAKLNELTASRDAAEEDARRLREELSRAREEPAANGSDNEKRLSFHITELESSLSAERLLHDTVRTKNEQFRTKINFLTTDLDNAREEISRLKAANVAQFPMPDDLDGQAAEAARLSQDLAVAHEDNADLQAELSNLRTRLNEKERELAEKTQDGAREESNTISDLRKQISELKSNRANAESATEDFEKEKATLTKSLDELRQELDKAEDAVKKSAEREVNLRQNNAKLVDKVKKAEASASDLTARLEEGASAITENDKQVKKLEKELEKLKSSSDKQLHKNSTKLQETIDQQADRLNEQEQSNQELAGKLETAEENRKAAESETAELKERLATIEAEAQSSKEKLKASEGKLAELDSSLSVESGLATENAAALEQVREKLDATVRKHEILEYELTEKHREEMETLKEALQSAIEEGERLREELENSQIGLSSAHENSVEEQAQLIAGNDAKVSELEEQLAESASKIQELESVRDDLEKKLNERDESIDQLKEDKDKLESEIEEAASEKEQLLTDLQLTKEGLSSALNAARQHLVTSIQKEKLESSIRCEAEDQLRQAEEAIEALRSELEVIRKESGEKIALSSGDTNLNRISELIEEKSDEQKEFETRLEAIAPLTNYMAPSDKNSRSSSNGEFSEEEFYRKLVDKLDLVDALMKRYENKWRYPKVAQQLALLKQAFLELLEDHSVNQFNLQPGTPLTMDQSQRIDLVPREDGTLPKINPFGKSEVVETVRPGYIFQTGSRDVILRKAEVVVA
ncbi:MAG: nucleotide exchange factor GrpE [Verrucomicrobiales bacterium]|nr:nucleotide exchange factor GrpE [Verrucomicrobiales bacterium]